MDRLTIDDIDDVLANSMVVLQGNELLAKITAMTNDLLKYKDLEEKIGCPLEVVFKAIKNGIWFTNEDDELECIDEALCFNTKRDSGKFIFDNYGYHCKNIKKMKFDEIYLEDYKKTWWLKGDRSE